jgi:hypothetical protein
MRSPCTRTHPRMMPLTPVRLDHIERQFFDRTTQNATTLQTKKDETTGKMIVNILTRPSLHNSNSGWFKAEPINFAAT